MFGERARCTIDVWEWGDDQQHQDATLPQFQADVGLFAAPEIEEREADVSVFRQSGVVWAISQPFRLVQIAARRIKTLTSPTSRRAIKRSC